MRCEVSLIAHTRRMLRSENQSRGGLSGLGRNHCLVASSQQTFFHLFLPLLPPHFRLDTRYLSLLFLYFQIFSNQNTLPRIGGWIEGYLFKMEESRKIVRGPPVYCSSRNKVPFPVSSPVLSPSPVSVFILAKREEVVPCLSLSLFALTRLHETRSFSTHSSPAWLFTPVALLLLFLLS